MNLISPSPVATIDMLFSKFPTVDQCVGKFFMIVCNIDTASLVFSRLQCCLKSSTCWKLFGSTFTPKKNVHGILYVSKERHSCIFDGINYVVTHQVFWYQSTVNSLSMALNPSKNETNKSIALWTSPEPAVSLIECIDNMGLPTSTVRIPIFESIGPSVVPQGLYIYIYILLLDSIIMLRKKNRNLHIISSNKMLYLASFSFNELFDNE